MDNSKERALKAVIKDKYYNDVLIGNIIFSGHRNKKYRFQMPYLCKDNIIKLSKNILGYEPQIFKHRHKIFQDIMYRAIQEDKVEQILSFIFKNGSPDKRVNDYKNYYIEKSFDKALDALNEALMKSNYFIAYDNNHLMITEAKYDKGYVAFLDILGFKNKIESKEFTDIYNVFQRIKSKKKDQDENNSNCDTKFLFCSDSIFITSHELDSVVRFASSLSLEIMESLDLGVRGAITYGEYFHSGNIVYGPAIIEACRLEKEEAKYSRIIIDQSVLNKMNSDQSNVLYKEAKKEISLNIFEKELLNIFDENSYGTMKKRREWILNKIHNTNQEEKNIKDKYTWLIRPFNLACKRYGNDQDFASLIINENQL